AEARDAAMRIGSEFLPALCCPACRGALEVRADEVTCTACEMHFPVVQGRPILISERHSVFSVTDYVKDASRITGLMSPQGCSRSLGDRLRALIPSRSLNTTDFSDAEMLAAAGAQNNHPRVRVIGCGNMQLPAAIPGVSLDRIVNSDISVVPQADVILD